MFSEMFIVISWIVLSFVAAAVGAEKKIGYFLTLILSLVFSPIVGFIAVMASSKKAERVQPCRFCGFKPIAPENFCSACGKDVNGKTREDYQKAAH